MGFDRSKLKSTTAATIQKQEKELSQKRPSGGFDKNYLSIEVGENKFRFFPYHPDKGGSSFAEAKCVTFLEVQVQKRGEDKKVIEGKFEIKRKPIFNSKVHGNLKKDLVEAYMDVAKTIAIPNFTSDQDEVKKIWSKIVGNHITKEQGIKPNDSWVVYASKWDGSSWGKVGLLELKKSVKDAMTEKALELETPDPFSDPEEGIAVIITKAKEAAKAADWYKVKLDTVKKGLNVSYLPTPLTDEQLEEWYELKSLHELYVNSFKRSDLDYQIEGLQRFDEKLAEDGYAINVFQYDEFTSVANELLDLVPEEEKKEETIEEEKVEKKVETKKVATISKPATTTVPPKQLIKKATPPPPVEEEAQEETEGEAEQIEIVVDKEEGKMSTKDRLAAIKAKIGKK